MSCPSVSRMARRRRFEPALHVSNALWMSALSALLFRTGPTASSPKPAFKPAPRYFQRTGGCNGNVEYPAALWEMAGTANATATLHSVRLLHSKLIWANDALFAVGSFSWFSARRTGKFVRHENSVVYRGDHLASEIQILEDSLKACILAL